MIDTSVFLIYLRELVSAFGPSFSHIRVEVYHTNLYPGVICGLNPTAASNTSVSGSWGDEVTYATPK